MTKWTNILSAYSKAFPAIPLELRNSFRSETREENGLRMAILGAFGLLASLFLMVFNSRFLNSDFGAQAGLFTMIHGMMAVWMAVVLVLSWAYRTARLYISPELHQLVFLLTGIFMLTWSFIVSVVYEAGMIPDWFYLVSVFSVFSLLLFPLIHLMVILSCSLAIQVLLIEWVFRFVGDGPGLFGASFIIMLIASFLSRILFHARVRNFLHWENIGQMNKTLRREVAMHVRTMGELEEVRQKLNEKVTVQTQHLQEANQRLSDEIAERRYADKVRSILYRISTFVNGHHDLEEIFTYIHGQLSSIMEARNFFVARLTGQLQVFDFIYERFEQRPSGYHDWNQSLCRRVLDGNSPVLLNYRELNTALGKSGMPDQEGVYRSWIGIPLRIENRFIGVLSVVNFGDSVRYDTSDRELLEYVSEHVSLAISRKDSEQILIDARDRAERSDQLKTTFLQNLSHEIRTPMNAIVGFSELFTEEDDDREERRYYAEQVIRNSKYLLKLISDIIDLSKIQSGEIAVRRVNLQVRTILKSLHGDFDSMRQQLDKTHLDITYEMDQRTAEREIFADRVLFGQVMHTIVENALKFTNKGSVTIGAREHDAFHMLFYVRDTGIGIEKDEIPEIFDYFRQGATAARQLYRGTGLGLALARALVQEHDGQIWVESAPGKGSTFFFTMLTGEESGRFRMAGKTASVDGGHVANQTRISAG